MCLTLYHLEVRFAYVRLDINSKRIFDQGCLKYTAVIEYVFQKSVITEDSLGPAPSLHNQWKCHLCKEKQWLCEKLTKM